MTNIHDLVNLLRDVRNCYQTEYNEALKKQEAEFTILDRDYRANSPTYTAKKQEIQLACDIAIIEARKKAAKKATEEIQELREWEQTGVSTINEAALTKINML